MTWSGQEQFNADTGQFHSPAPPLLPSTVTNGSITIGGGQGVISYPDNNQYSAQCFYLPAAGDPDDNSYVAMDLLGYTHPPAQAFDVLDVALVKDGSNTIFFDAGVVISAGNGVRVTANFSGSRFNGTQTGAPNASVPYSIAIAWQGNIFSVWVLYATGWLRISAADYDASSHHDFTAPGGRVGWRPGFVPACQPNDATFTVTNLRWGPISDLTNQFNYLPPTNLSVTSLSNTAIGLMWSPSDIFVGSGVPPADHYAVFRDGVLIGITNGGNTFITDTGVFLASTPYVYTVQASDAIGTALSGLSVPLTVFVNPVNAYGKFVGSKVFKAVEISRVGEIEPRIWPTRKNNTVYG